MRIKNEDVRLATEAALKLSQQKMPFKAAMPLRKLLRELTEINKDIAAEHKKLLDEYAQKGDDGQPLIENGRYVLGDNQAALDAAYTELIAVEADVRQTIKASDLDGMTEVEPYLLFGLGPLLVE